MPHKLSIVGGGLVVRGGQVLLIHRRKQGDWTLPKGRVNRNELPMDCAVREVQEETTLECRRICRLLVDDYRGEQGRPKRAFWYLMKPIYNHVEPLPTWEVDSFMWVPPQDTADWLSERDLGVVRLLEQPICSFF